MHHRKGGGTRALIGVTRRFRVVLVVSVPAQDYESNAVVMSTVRKNLEGRGMDGAGGPMVFEKVEDVEAIRDLDRRDPP